ncbi:MAG: hypothetical protein INR66_25825 [Gordonia polyisoprenivorans]|nr:hypothetical protein [Gordonia polyisoprenivorans]
MTHVIAYIRREPVRTALLPLITALVAYLVARGTVSESLAPIILAVVALALGLPATEVIRSQVTPVSKVPEVVSAQVGAVIGKAAAELGPQLGPDSRRVVDALAAQARAYVGQHRR